MSRLPAIVVSVLLCAAAASGVYFLVGQVLDLVRDSVGGLDAPVSGAAEPVHFRVEPGQSASEIGAALESRRLIRSARVFRVLVEREGVGNRLAAGEYELSPSLSTREVIAVLAGGHVRRGLAFTVPEGWRAEEIAWKLDRLSPGAGEEFLETVYTGDAFVEDVQLVDGVPLEGFLFPDTYEWHPEQGARRLVERMVGEFLRHFDQRRRAQAAERGLTPREIVTLASIVEREAALPEERGLIAAVYHNRLARGMRLDADPTVQYALASPRVPAPSQALWKRELALPDLDIASPYNTYRRVGLPPAPICNPGLAALDAALNPAPTDALYFVARGDGGHVFARTVEEHLANIRRYQGGRAY